MRILVNGEFSLEYRDHFDPPDRAIKLPNITIELLHTPDGGWREKTTAARPPDGGGSMGHSLTTMARYPWVTEQMWRRIVELEDELRALRKAISYKEI